MIPTDWYCGRGKAQYVRSGEKITPLEARDGEATVVPSATTPGADLRPSARIAEGEQSYLQAQVCES